MSTQAVQVAQSTQYAMKKRKRPKPRSKNPPVEAQVKSNPSKRHRDRLNTELDRLSQLIPLPTDVVNKLDKLSILRLSVAYLRNKSYSKHIELEEKSNENKALLPISRNQQQPTPDLSESELALQALDGFIMVVTEDFNVFYITSTVQDCLGFPQSDVIYQSMLDLIHAEDRKLFMKQMLINPMGPGPDQPPEDGDPPTTPDYVRHGLTPDVVKQLSQDGLLHRSFICRLRCLHDTSSGFLALHFTGHLGLVPGQNRHQKDGAAMPPELGLFLLASPLQTPSILEIRTKNYIFRTKHKLDYTPLGIDQKGRIVLGYTEQELRQQSGYQFIHSADMMHCADAHTKLMKKGQSGLTVFRLLHRANRWQWVTASSRLIFNKGDPDYIISTHRPITEQEGEEHLTKRSVAFRFDFTGHASLYASVNPIGAGPPPSNNNRSYEGPPDTKPSLSGPKRPRISEQEIDPATIFGAQSFQSMSNYPDGLPMVEAVLEPSEQEIDPATIFGAQSFQSMSNYPDGLPMVKAALEPTASAPYNDPTGVVKSENPFANDMGELLFNDGSLRSVNSPQRNGFNKMTSPRSDNADSGYSDTDFQNSPVYNEVLQSLKEAEPSPPIQINQANTQQYFPGYQSLNHISQHQQIQPQSHVSAAPQMNQAQNWSAQSQVRGPQQQVPRPQHGMMTNVGVFPNPREISVQNGVGHQYGPSYQNPPTATNYHQQTHGYPSQSPPVRQIPQPQQSRHSQQQQQHYDPRPTQYQQRVNQPPMHSNHVGMYHQQQQMLPQPYNSQPGQSQVQETMPPRDNTTHNFINQINPQRRPMTKGYHEQSQTTARPKENISILNAIEISSTITAGHSDQKRKEMEDMIGMLGPDDPSKEQFEISLECQENTIQFDMDKIAAEYQTTNPLGIIQKYVQNNPTDALALATGTMPDAGLRNQMPSNVTFVQQDRYQHQQYNHAPVATKTLNQAYPHPGMNHVQHQVQQQQHLRNRLPVKSEKRKDEFAEFNLDDFLTFDAPNI